MQQSSMVNTKEKGKPMAIVGMSGGVDSSVAAALLKEQGYRVVGIFMKNWEEVGEGCQVEQDFLDVQKVCHHLNIPCYSIQFVREYREQVFNPMVSGYKEGLTPQSGYSLQSGNQIQGVLQADISSGCGLSGDRTLL